MDIEARVKKFICELEYAFGPESPWVNPWDEFEGRMYEILQLQRDVIRYIEESVRK